MQLVCIKTKTPEADLASSPNKLKKRVVTTQELLKFNIYGICNRFICMSFMLVLIIYSYISI